MDDQGDLTRVEIINDKHINTTENLLIVENYQEKSTLMKTVESNLHQNLIPSTLDAMPTVVEHYLADNEKDKSIPTASTSCTLTPHTSAPEHEGELKYISPYLIQYVPVKRVKKIAAAGKYVHGAWVLTSDKCVHIFS